jgi:hypothetical protein
MLQCMSWLILARLNVRLGGFAMAGSTWLQRIWWADMDIVPSTAVLRPRALSLRLQCDFGAVPYVTQRHLDPRSFNRRQIADVEHGPQRL